MFITVFGYVAGITCGFCASYSFETFLPYSKPVVGWVFLPSSAFF